MQKLINFLEKNHITGKDFAALVETEPSTISRLIRRGFKPRIELALRIQKATKGAVKVTDWAGKS